MGAWISHDGMWHGPGGQTVPHTDSPVPATYPYFGTSVKATANTTAWYDKFSNETLPAYGGVAAIRTFNTGNIGNWTSGNVGHILSTTPSTFGICHSWKGWSLPEFITWAESKPDDGRPVWASYNHEPENDETLNSPAYFQWSATWNQRQRDMSDALQAIGRTDIKLVGILMSWTLAAGSGRDINDWHPGLRTDGTHYWDEAWWDPYNGGMDGGYYADPAGIVQGVHAASLTMGDLPFGIGEFGTGIVPSDTDGSGRAAWIAGYSQECVNLGATGVLYWDSQVGETGHRHIILDDPVALAAYTPFTDASRAFHNVPYPLGG